jgi:hypothetical protein
MREMDIQLRTLLDSKILFITWMFLIVVNPILLFVEPLDRVSKRVYLSVKYEKEGREKCGGFERYFLEYCVLNLSSFFFDIWI